MSDAGGPIPVAAPRKTFGMLWYWLALVLIALFAIFPMVLFFIGITIAGDRECNISESVASVCMINGTNWGETLQFFGLAPLFLVATIPIAIGLFIVWVIVLLVHQHYFDKRQRAR